MKGIENVCYEENEWVVLYVDECGDKQIEIVDTYEQAEQFSRRCGCRIGIMTCRFFNHYLVEKLNG